MLLLMGMATLSYGYSQSRYQAMGNAFKRWDAESQPAARAKAAKAAEAVKRALRLKLEREGVHLIIHG